MVGQARAQPVLGRAKLTSVVLWCLLYRVPINLRALGHHDEEYGEGVQVSETPRQQHVGDGLG